MDDKLERLVRDAYNAGARSAIMAAHSLLQIRNIGAGADALITHWESIVTRAMSVYDTHNAISKAQQREVV